jgi:SAM-dependent methyltransferase
MPATQKPDYGLDAPGVVRNLLIAGGILLLIAGAASIGWIPSSVGWHSDARGDIQIAVLPSIITPGIALCATACWMYYNSKYGKVAEREKLLDRIAWRGDEQVLDVGCGRGLLLVGAAHRLKTGTAVGVDIWRSDDLSGNSAEAPLRNASIEGVADRVRVETADMRRLPFADRSFDIVISRAAIHNLYTSRDRVTAIREIARVLRPGGRALINDIRHHREYMKTFREAGCTDLRLLDPAWLSILCACFTMGSLRPNTLLVQKPAA